MADKCVVRNAQYRRGGLNKRERHNERKNADYQNEDIIKERAALNVHFKQTTGGYESVFDSMVAEGTISTRGLGKDPNIVDELVFDVNSGYFENHGGYEYAKSFFEEAYRCAVKEIGGEQYVLSAVMHADERNRALSEQLGRDVFHYHLHVVYVPVVDKKIYFKKNNRNPELAGKLREIIKQVSHSKKWPRLKKLDEHGDVIRNAKGSPILVNAYSTLQDHFFEHMWEAGFRDFERGDRGSTTEHLTVLEYKAKQEGERAAALSALVEQKQGTADALDQQITKKKQRLETLKEKTVVAKAEMLSVSEINHMSEKRNWRGDISVSPSDWKTVSSLAKEGAKSRSIIADLKKRVSDFLKKITWLEQRLEQFEGKSVTDSMQYFTARQRAPRRMAEIIAEIMRSPPEKQEQKEPLPGQKRRHDLSV